ncbi:hypothetical protein IJG14_07040 [bacterium]|nr:hypothetical protein [bacterium]
MTVILGVKTEDRFETAKCIQKILTDYGCFIKTRLGLHNILEDICPKYALMLIEIPRKEKAVLIEEKLLDISGIEIQRMEFDIN